MAKLAVNVVLEGPDGAPVALLEGDEVPDWAKDEIGDHCLEQSKPKAADKASAK